MQQPDGTISRRPYDVTGYEGRAHGPRPSGTIATVESLPVDTATGYRPQDDGHGPPYQRNETPRYHGPGGGAAPAHMHNVEGGQEEGSGGQRKGWFSVAKRNIVPQVVVLLMLVVTLALGLQVSFVYISPGAMFGSLLTLISALLILFSYLGKKKNRRHPNPLLFYRSMIDLLFAIRVVGEAPLRCILTRETEDQACAPLSQNGEGGGYDDLCRTLGAISEFLILSSLCWFLCLSVDLYLSLTNPFTNFKANVKKYHIFSWGFPLFMSIVLVAANYAGQSTVSFCWARADPVQEGESDKFTANITAWAFLYIWVILFIVFSIVIVVISLVRLRDGIQKTIEVRREIIRVSSTYVSFITGYWVILVFVYVIYLSTVDLNLMAADENNEAKELNKSKAFQAVNYVICAQGYVDFLVWFLVNDFKFSDVLDAFRQCGRRKGAQGEGAGGEAEQDNSLDPQVNTALREEVLYNTVSGIRLALEEAGDVETTDRKEFYLAARTERGEVGGRAPSGQQVKRGPVFTAYKHNVFKHIRAGFGMTNAKLSASLEHTTKARISEGASGAFMFFSQDKTLIVKSMSGEECTFLQSIAEQYGQYLVENKKTLLTRIYGCYSLKMYRQTFCFVVMANLFYTDKQIHYRYDIKGSWVNRNMTRTKRGKKVTCRHCNQKYIFGVKSHCDERLLGHEPDEVLKDNDLKEKLRLPETEAQSTYHQIRKDTKLLRDVGIMDYSLLIGVSELTYQVDNPRPLQQQSTREEDEEREYRDSFSTIQNSKDDSNDVVYSAVGPQTDAQANPFAYGEVFNYDAPINQNYERDTQPGGLTRRLLSEQLRQRRLEERRQRQMQEGGEPSGGEGLGRDGGEVVALGRSGGEMHRGMRRANYISGPGFYFIGIIDILQTWTLQKRLERLVKITLKGAEGKGLSAIPPKDYRARFLAKVTEILGVTDESGDAYYPS